MSFVQKSIAASGHRFFYLNAKVEGGKDAWYFVLVKELKERAFNKLDYSKPFKITDYGNIVESGYGATPPQTIIESINLKYQTNFTA